MENGKNFPPDTIPRAYEEKRETGPPPEAPVPTPLTEPQRRFAAQYHALIYGFLLEKKLEIREYYDIAAIGYLHAVQRYFTEKSLHRYRFSTIAWRSMNSSLHTFQRQERRRESCEQSYLTMPRTPSDDAFDALQARLLLHDLFLLASPPLPRSPISPGKTWRISALMRMALWRRSRTSTRREHRRVPRPPASSGTAMSRIWNCLTMAHTFR